MGRAAASTVAFSSSSGMPSSRSSSESMPASILSSVRLSEVSVVRRVRGRLRVVHVVVIQVVHLLDVLGHDDLFGFVLRILLCSISHAIVLSLASAPDFGHEKRNSGAEIQQRRILQREDPFKRKPAGSLSATTNALSMEPPWKKAPCRCSSCPIASANLKGKSVPIEERPISSRPTCTRRAR